ncbi:MAG: hypothetical protein LBL19_03230 [Spirochaetaceae bacterium]|jgi:hypothetical protein|nr:hypothetical protein [Spirochaetaceae bacterium]
MDYKKIFEKVDDQSIFIKTTAKPVIDGSQKAALNRKGNILYNSGDIEGARRIFLTTGYSDGLVRIGDYYKSKGRELDALRMYWIAPDRNKAEPIIMRLSAIIQNLINEEEDHFNE